MTDPDVLQEVAGVFAELAAADRSPVIVHGGGPFIASALDEAGLPHRFERGLRVTTPESMVVIERVLTLLNKQLSQATGNAVGLTGRDAELVLAERLGGNLGLVGRVISVNRELLTALLGAGITPVLTCVAVDRSGSPLNVNADEVAGAVAGALGAPVLFLSNVPGVLDDSEDKTSLLSQLRADEVQARIADGRVSGGMIPKLEAALDALELGATRAVIASGETPDAVQNAANFEGGTTILP